MKLGRIVLKNFLSYDRADIDFSKVRKALIVGSNNGDHLDSNGSGKTNLFESIAWNGWGQSKAETIDLNVKHGKDECIVEHHFEHDGKQVAIIRSRNKKTGSSNLDLIIDGVVSNGATVTDTNKKIQEFLNLDYDTFINSVYIKQDDVNSLANSKDSNGGRDLLEKVLNLDTYDAFHERTKEKVRELEQKHSIVKQFIDSNSDVEQKKQDLANRIVESETVIDNIKKSTKIISLEIDSLKLGLQHESANQTKIDFLNSSLASLNKDLETATNELADLRSRAIAYKEKLDSKIASIEEAISNEPALIERLRSLNAETDASKKAFLEIKTIDDENTATSAQVDILNEKVNVHKNDKRVLEYQINQLDAQKRTAVEQVENPKIKPGDVCEHCLTEINENSLDHYMSHLGSKIEEIESSIGGINGSLAATNSEIDKLTSAINNAKTDMTERKRQIDVTKKQNRSIDAINLDRASIERAILDLDAKKKELEILSGGEELNQWKSMVGNKKELIKMKKEEIEKVEGEISNITIDTKKIKLISDQIASKELELDKNKTTILENELFIKNSHEQIGAFDIIISNVKTKKIELEKIESDISVYNNLTTAFSSRGIRSYILENALAELEKEANSILERLSNGRLSIEFKTKKEIKKSKNEKQEKMIFEVLINDGQKTFPFSSYSGGEKFRISFVLRVALSKLLLRRAHSKLEFLIIDEAVSPLDGNGVEKIIEIINDLQDEFKTILVITHRNDVKNYFDEIITVNKGETGSTVQISN